jgi:hypothetical protein
MGVLSPSQTVFVWLHTEELNSYIWRRSACFCIPFLPLLNSHNYALQQAIS